MGSYYDKLKAQMAGYDNYPNYPKEKKQKDQHDECSWDKKEKDTNSIVNIVKVNVNCCDHKKDQYKKGYWDYKEEKYKEY